MMFQYMAKRSYKQQLSSETHRHTDSLSFFQTQKSFAILDATASFVPPPVIIP